MQSNEHKHKKKKFHCEVCKKHLKNKSKLSHINSDTQKENEVLYKLDNKLNDKTYTYFDQEFDQVDASGKRTIDGCIQKLRRFKKKCAFVIKTYYHPTCEIITYFTLPNNFQKST